MTRMPRLAAAAATLSLAITLSACTGTQPSAEGSPTGTAVGTATSTATATTPPSSAVPVDAAHNDADTMFAQMMVEHHQGAIEMASLAEQKATTADVRSLAGRISAAQDPEIKQMNSWLAAWGEQATASGGHGGHGGMEMDGLTQEQAMAQLSGLAGTDFDRRFLELMTAHHQGAVAMAQDELANGRNRQARDLAQTIIDDQQAEIAEMQQMRQRL